MFRLKHFLSFFSSFFLSDYNQSLVVFLYYSKAKVISAVVTVVFYGSCQGPALLTHLVPVSCTSQAVFSTLVSAKMERTSLP